METKLHPSFFILSFNIVLLRLKSDNTRVFRGPPEKLGHWEEPSVSSGRTLGSEKTFIWDDLTIIYTRLWSTGLGKFERPKTLARTDTSHWTILIYNVYLNPRRGIGKGDQSLTQTYRPCLGTSHLLRNEWHGLYERVWDHWVTDDPRIET